MRERVNAPPIPFAPFLRALRQRGVEREAPGEQEEGEGEVGGEVGCVDGELPSGSHAQCRMRQAV